MAWKPIVCWLILGFIQLNLVSIFQALSSECSSFVFNADLRACFSVDFRVANLPLLASGSFLANPADGFGALLVTYALSGKHHNVVIAS